MKNQNIIIPIIVAIIVGGAAFFAGSHYQSLQRGNSAANRNGNFMMAGGQRGNGANQNGQRGAGFRPIMGEIISSDDKSITIKLDDGSTKIVLISDTTPINKTDPGSKSDLKTGTKVGVFGADNNGTITAQNIQLNPQNMRTGSPSATPAAK